MVSKTEARSAYNYSVSRQGTGGHSLSFEQFLQVIISLTEIGLGKPIFDNKYITLRSKVEALFQAMNLHDVKSLRKLIRDIGPAEANEKHLFFLNITVSIILFAYISRVNYLVMKFFPGNIITEDS